MSIALFLAASSSPPAEYFELPAARQIDWSGMGVTGGIPTRTTIYTTITPTGSDQTAALQAAIDGCPSGQVVKINAGTLVVDGVINWDSSSVTVRGSGPTNTTVRFDDGYIYMRSGSGFQESQLSSDVNLSADAVKGATTLTTATNPSTLLVAGRYYILDQLNDSAFVADTGTEGGASYRDILGNGDRGLSQMIKVTNVSGSGPFTITTELPIAYGFSTAQTAQIAGSGSTSWVTGNGIEDLKLEGNYTGSDDDMVKLENCADSWMLNVWSYNTPGGGHFQPNFCYRLTVRDCKFEESHSQASGQGYGASFYHVTSHCLIENNIFLNLHLAMALNYGCCANVFGYNYEDNGESDSGQNPAMGTHGVHPYMNLFEGNWTKDKFLGDWTHGSASHQVLFRNKITGNVVSPVRDDERCCISLEYYTRYCSAVGNVLGTNGLQNKYISHTGSTSQGSEGSIMKLGGEVNINDDYSPGDANDYTSGNFFLNHGNYNYVDDDFNWEADESNHNLPVSLYLTEKPDFFSAAMAWPPIGPDPDTPTTKLEHDIPAKLAFDTGNMPNYLRGT